MGTLNIPIGGENVPIPEWATETTLTQLRAILDRNNMARDVLLKGINNQADDIRNLAKGVNTLGKIDAETDYERSQKVSSTIRGVTNTFVRTAQRFGDTSKPSLMVEMTGDA